MAKTLGAPGFHTSDLYCRAHPLNKFTHAFRVMRWFGQNKPGMGELAVREALDIYRGPLERAALKVLLAYEVAPRGTFMPN